MDRAVGELQRRAGNDLDKAIVDDGIVRGRRSVEIDRVAKGGADRSLSRAVDIREYAVRRIHGGNFRQVQVGTHRLDETAVDHAIHVRRNGDRAGRCLDGSSRFIGERAQPRRVVDPL